MSKIKQQPTDETLNKVHTKVVKKKWTKTSMCSIFVNYCNNKHSVQAIEVTAFNSIIS